MSNILIIKHGSLGDIVQISGVIKDLRENHSDKKIFILTTLPYVEVLSACPYIDGVIIDKRLPRWNFFYLLKLSKMIKKSNFLHVYDLQNSKRTSFYRKYIFGIKNWSSTETTLKKDESKDGPVSVNPSQLADLVNLTKLSKKKLLNYINEKKVDLKILRGNKNRDLSDIELLNRDYYQGRFASKNKDGKIVYNWDTTTSLDFD